MGCLLERKTQIIFVTASSVEENGKSKKVVIESRPTFAIVRLHGSRERFSIAWEAIYEAARKNHIKNLQLEEKAASSSNRAKKKPAKRINAR
jgi:hypothetical protein